MEHKFLEPRFEFTYWSKLWLTRSCSVWCEVYFLLLYLLRLYYFTLIFCTVVMSLLQNILSETLLYKKSNLSWHIARIFSRTDDHSTFFYIVYKYNFLRLH